MLRVFSRGGVLPSLQAGLQMTYERKKKESDKHKFNRDERWRLEARRLVAPHDTLAMHSIN
jgi:hypothetical protein